MSRPIHGQQFLDWLRASGIIPESTRRVVIDAKVGEVVRMYCEQYGSDALISVEPPSELRGAMVTIVGKLNGGLMS